MACFTKTQQSNGTNCEFENYVTTSKFFVLNTLDNSHRNSVRAQYECDKSENARVCAKWQWNALDWCYWIALPASPVVQSSNTVSCVSLSFRTHSCVLAIRLDIWNVNSAWQQYSFSSHKQMFLWVCRSFRFRKCIELRGLIVLVQHCFRWWAVAWRHQTIALTISDYSSEQVYLHFWKTHFDNCNNMWDKDSLRNGYV